MKLVDFQKDAVALYQSGMSVILKSAPGRGKTTTIEGMPAIISAALNKSIGLSLVSGPNLTPGDTMGFGIPKHGEKHSEMVFTLPFFWRTSEGKLLEEYDGGIIFVDEADKMDVDIKKVMGEMALSGRCGPHRLPPGWVVWMAGNRAEDRSGSTRELDHLINRRLEIDVQDDIEGWEAWAHKNNVHPSIIAFAVGNPQVVFPEKLPEKQGPFCTPRSLVNVGKFLVTLGGNDATKPLPDTTSALEWATAGIGHAAAGQLFATIRLEHELPSLDSIIASPSGAKLPSKPDAQMLVCYKLASLSNEKNLAPIVQYVERLPADFAATFAKSVVTRVPTMVAHKAIREWCQRNQGLMTILSALKN
jgi:hypothetical protein